jgi:ribonucleoside-diphosphate reductase beta chain
MDTQTELDIVRRVEAAPLRELVSIDIDDVVVQMDHLLNPEMDSAGFYRRWETQQWAVSDLDFTQDKADWAKMTPGVREGVRRTLVAFFIGEQAVTDTLSPLLHAAPREDERIFLATQIADEARHTVFFQRFFEEVLELGGGLSSALAAIGDDTSDGYKKIFDEDLVDATELVRREPANQRAWVEGMVTYHIIIEAFLAVNGQRTTLRLLRRTGFLPAFYAGFTAVARDESRHIGFGVMALRRRVQENPEVGRWIALKVLELLPAAVSTGTGRGRRLTIDDPNQVPAVMRVDPVEARNFAIESLAKRLRSIGLSEKTVKDVEDHARSLYEESWDHYQKTFGIMHPARYWERGLVTA